MDLDSAGRAAKRSRSGNKTAAATTATVTKAPNARSRKSKAAVEPPIAEPSVLATPAMEVISMTTLTPAEDELTALIRTAAYYMAERRLFQPGHELDDWLHAEREIMGRAA